MLTAPGSTASSRRHDGIPRFTVAELNQAIRDLQTGNFIRAA
jgi:exodeoxyribonuclease VII large subunit